MTANLKKIADILTNLETVGKDVHVDHLKIPRYESQDSASARAHRRTSEVVPVGDVNKGVV